MGREKKEGKKERKKYHLLRLANRPHRIEAKGSDHLLRLAIRSHRIEVRTFSLNVIDTR